jgi:Zn-dependent peptidase ImmA (M78 family)
VVEAMRVFSKYFDVVPIIVVNGGDAPRARLFSLLNEYAHLLLHTSGLCDVRSDATTTAADRKVEARCNKIAAEILMPEAAVMTLLGLDRRRAAHRPRADSTLIAVSGSFDTSSLLNGRRHLLPPEVLPSL